MLFLRIFLLLILCCGNGPCLFAESTPSTILQLAKTENANVYLFLYKDQNQRTLAAEKEFDQAMLILGDKAKSLKINTTAAEAKGLLEQLGLKRAPTPLAMVLAPNGAVMGSFAISFTAPQLVATLTSTGAAHCLKALQDRKLVLLCIQNSNSAESESAMVGVHDFVADSRFSKGTEVVVIDPSKLDEQSFLEQLGVEKSHLATTVMITPPGEVIGRYRGATSKEKFVTDLQCASSGCCAGGCCPGGCCGK